MTPGAQGTQVGRSAPQGRPGGPAAVVHLVSSAVGRGAQVYARTLVDALGGPAAGHQLWSLFDGEDDVAVDATVGLPGGARAVEGMSLVAVRRLRRVLRRLGPAAVVAHGGDVLKYAAMAGPAPVVYYAIGPLSEVARTGRRRRLWRAIARRPVRVAAVTEQVAAECTAILGVDPARVSVIPNGRDPARFRPADRPNAAMADAGDPAAPVTLCTVGRLEPRKDPFRFVALVAALRARGLAVQGRIVGDGPLAAALAGPAASAGVALLGQRDDVVAELHRSDIFVFLPAPPGEGMPGVLIEAALCGLPSVVADVPGTAAVVVDGRTGTVVAGDDTEALLRAVTDLATDPARRRALGRAARDHASAAFSLEGSVAAWRALLADVVGGNPAVGPGTERGAAP